MPTTEIKIVKKKFVDIDLSFQKHPVTNDILKKVNEQAISASIKNLVLTKIYGRPFHPELSSQVQDLLFEQLTPGTITTLKRTIKYVIDNFEPRADVQLIDVKEAPDGNGLNIIVIYRIIGSVENVKTQFQLQRTL